MKKGFCTITTYDYLHKVLALYFSLKEQDENVELNVLVVDPPENPNLKFGFQNIYFTLPEHIKDHSVAQPIFEAYFPDHMDFLRWSLKSVFLHYLLVEKDWDQIIYLDNDIAFFDDFEFLFGMLNDRKVLLTPHWRNLVPEVDEDNFANNYLDGVFNGGFFAAAKGSESILQWWAKVNLYKCVKDKAAGFFVDQRYLDVLPARFEGVGIVRHQGCNIACWNKTDIKRTWSESGILINDKWPVVFLHLTNDMMREIRAGVDPLLLPHLEKYDAWIREAEKLVI